MVYCKFIVFLLSEAVMTRDVATRAICALRETLLNPPTRREILLFGLLILGLSWLLFKEPRVIDVTLPMLGTSGVVT
jgi:hypothetical protein